ncbi:MAG: hypothetical protein FJX67_14925 [Alphaproteobacteria bacterium]|nr:hypothetical protein [Alphaproteobacteria bacterium]
MMTKRSVETLIDLVEIKLSAMQVMDREDERERVILETRLKELTAIRAEIRGARAARQTAADRQPAPIVG